MYFRDDFYYGLLTDLMTDNIMTSFQNSLK